MSGGTLYYVVKCPGGSLLRSRVSGGHSTTRGRLLHDRAHGHRGGNGMGTRAQAVYMIYIRTCSREVGGREESVARALGRRAGSIYIYIYVHAVGRWVGERRQWHGHSGAEQAVYIYIYTYMQ